MGPVSWIKSAVIALALALPLCAQDARNPPKDDMIAGPSDKADFGPWIAGLKHWRQDTRIRIGYDGSQYDRPELEWTQRSFMQPQMMIHDRYFFDSATGQYTVDRYLDDLNKRFGGIDSVLIWQGYPNLGVDNRNQYDLIRDMPGGIPAIRAMIEDFHRHGVRVLFPVTVWDQGTRNEGVPDSVASTKLMAELGADGLNGDTLYEFPHIFRNDSDSTGHPIALEPQVPPQQPGEQIAWNNLSWNDWILMNYFHENWHYPFIPEVASDKWLEPRHQINLSDRWTRDKTDDLQHVFFNGVGFETWENIFGVWNGITERDAETIRRIGTIDRGFAGLLISQSWEPHTQVLQYGVFASKFPGNDRTLWTFINRNEYSVAGPQIEVPYEADVQYYDVWSGVRLSPEVNGSVAVLSFKMEPHGFGAVLAASKLTGEEETLIEKVHAMAARPLSSYSREWHPLPQQIVGSPDVKPPQSVPEGMIRIPGGRFTFEVSGNEIEGGNDAGVDVQMSWEDVPGRHHLHIMEIKPFYIDKFPVTNAEFKKFLDATHYQPKDDHNFLKDWKNGTYPEGWDARPVTWVSIEDARAYAAWKGARLPHEWEWQYAAQGTDGRLYPWGNQWNPEAVPAVEHGRDLGPPPTVGGHPGGSSPFGVMDMVGTVWQWTDEYQDDHTSAAILRGGSYYQPQGSMWYFPQATKLNEHSKYLLMAPSIDRSATIGFRCVVSAE
jgi:gamma-glutamyl hercynylcysteine S-oxide synthase